MLRPKGEAKNSKTSTQSSSSICSDKIIHKNVTYTSLHKINLKKLG